MVSVKGVATFWLLLLLSSCPSFRLVIPALGERGLLCVDLGQSDRSYYSIGALRHEPQDLEPMGPQFYATYGPGAYPPFKSRKDFPNDWHSKGCPEGMEFDWDRVSEFCFIDYCPKDIEIRAYLVRQNGRVLNGWLHFEVELTDPKDEMQWIYVQTRDEHFNAIGEFVTNEDEQCSSASKKVLISPSKYQVLPCSLIGHREAKASNGIFMAKRSQYKKPLDKHYLPKEDLKKGIHFTWRLNEYWCNRHLRFRLDAHVWTTKNMTTWRKTRKTVKFSNGYEVNACPVQKNRYCRHKRKATHFWLHAKLFGSADIKIPGQLDCTTPAIDFNSGVLAQEASAWLASSSLMTVGTDYDTEETTTIVFTPGLGNERVFESCQHLVTADSPVRPCKDFRLYGKYANSRFFKGPIHIISLQIR